ncbi:hypothetical protein BTE48_05330 [Oceanospirillum multiglobuliferum]|uniref:Hydrolase TatD n=1 Tax=Oceanospirillum multiglobuliferum TaxID=64969 RepID=A0A1V4T6A6_9GAMM|nr:hypothetical protein BTE48_05330 [Oceanospirillum multiglobuliferum]
MIDSHCHIDFHHYHHDRADVLKQAAKVGVRQLIIPAVSAQYWPRVLSLSGEFCGVQLFCTLGLHPIFMAEHKPIHLKQLEQLLMQHQGHVVAVGEIGLDFSDKACDKAAQLALFQAQLDIAEQFQLPVILHVVKAHEQVLKQLKARPNIVGIVHGFSGSFPQAQQYIQQGFLLGVGGVITWPNAAKKRQLFSQLPLSALALETDAPDMSPAGLKGERNRPDQVLSILDQLASIRNESTEEIAKTTSQNVIRLMSLNKVCRLY